MQHEPFDVTPSSPRNMRTQRLVEDLSGQDLSHIMPGVTATGGVLVNFFYVPVRIKSSDPVKNGTYVNRLAIAKQPRSERATVATNFITPEDAKRLFPREYEAFVKNEDLPTTGTPLSELPGITASQMGLLQLAGLRSVEDLMEISDEEAREIGLDGTRAKRLAEVWTKRKADAAETIDLAAMQARITEMERQASLEKEQMAKRIAELEAANSALKSIGGGAGQAGGAMAQTGEPAAAMPEENLPYDFKDMPNVMAEGPGRAEIKEPFLADPLED